MAPHLLKLPGEIRNRIYEYALTDPKGVFYVENAPNIGTLVAYDERSKKRLLENKNPESRARLIQKIGYSITTARDPNGRSIKRRKVTTIKTPREPKRPLLQRINQLRFVNRQLRKETHKLVMRCSPMWFIGPNINALADCHDFLRSCRSQHALLQTITISVCVIHLDEIFEPYLVTVKNFCSANPGILVKCRSHQLKQTDGTDFLKEVMNETFNLGNSKAFATRMAKGTSFSPEDLIYKRLAELPIYDKKVHKMLSNRPPNMLFLPHDEVFDANIFCEAIQNKLQ